MPARLAGLQALAEVTIGSIVHGFKLPLGGHALSLNQSFILSWAMRGARSRRQAVQVSSRISNAAAALKALSPLGQRLAPMLAISVQGALFSVGVGVLGPSSGGAALGAALAALWGFVQPLILGYLFFGLELYEAIARLWIVVADAFGIAPEWGMRLLIALVSAKAAIAAGLSLGATRARSERLESYSRWIELGAGKASPAAHHLPDSAWRDLFSAPFILCLALSTGFLALSGPAPSTGQVAWYVLRVVAIAWLVTWVARELPRSRRFRAWLEQRPELQAATAYLLSRLPGEALGEALTSESDRAPEQAAPQR